MNIPFYTPIFDEEMEKAAVKALKNDFFVLGESVKRFEEMFAEYIGVDYAVSVSSGTTALHLGLLALGIKPDSKVITTPMSFIATSNAIIHASSEPVFADINPVSWNINLNNFKNPHNSKAIIPVHLYGRPCDMDEIIDFADHHKLKIIEDACQAHGAEFGGKRIGSIGDVGCFSFYSTKNMTVCGDGGMVTTNSRNVAKMIEKLRNSGRVSQYEHDTIGYTARLNSVNCAIGIEQLKKLEGWNKKRRKNADIYRKNLRNVDGVALPAPDSYNMKSVYHLFVIHAEKREALISYMKNNGVSCMIHYPIPLHLQPIYKTMYGYKEGDFPVSEYHAKNCVSLPMSPGISKEEIEYICEKIKEFYV